MRGSLNWSSTKLSSKASGVGTAVGTSSGTAGTSGSSRLRSAGDSGPWASPAGESAADESSDGELADGKFADGELADGELADASGLSGKAWAPPSWTVSAGPRALSVVVTQEYKTSKAAASGGKKCLFKVHAPEDHL
jgi:hypothetical protein